jgi:hypothetical protein
VAKKVSRRLVIDASVARSATLSDNPTSTACREFLQAILAVCHRIVLSAEISREWERHALQTQAVAELRRTRFLANWMVAMSRRKGGKILRVSVNRDDALRTKVNRLGLPEASRQEIAEIFISSKALWPSITLLYPGTTLFASCSVASPVGAQSLPRSSGATRWSWVRKAWSG